MPHPSEVSDPRLLGTPHTVSVSPSVRGSVLLIGYDRQGEVMVEFRVPRARYTKRMSDRLLRWVKENDDSPGPLALLL